VAVDGVRGTPDQLRKQLSRHSCAGKPVAGCVAQSPARLTIKRGNATVTVSARPRYSVAAGRPLLGFTFGETQSQNVVQAAGSAVTAMWTVTKATVTAIGKLFYSAKARKDVHGVVGSYETTRQ